MESKNTCIPFLLALLGQRKHQTPQDRDGQRWERLKKRNRDEKKPFKQNWHHSHNKKVSKQEWNKSKARKKVKKKAN